jgi:hypothetical protein
MSSIDRTAAFKSILRQKGIAEVSSAIPDEIGRFRQGIPNPADLVTIPQVETFPLEEFVPAEKLSPVEGRVMFCQYQLQTIVRANLPYRPSHEVKCTGPIVEFPTEFESIDDLLAFKQDLATVFQKRSDAVGWPQSFKVCRFPTCLNSVAPSFEYCLFHLPKDPRFETQKFVSVCKVQTEDHQCSTPCGIGPTKCAFHRTWEKNPNHK